MSKQTTGTKFLSLVLSLMMALSLFMVTGTVTASADTLTGGGTEANPYKIGSYEQLKEFAQKINKGEQSAWGELTQDIDAYSSEADKDWPLITQGYRGTFDGKGFAIKGLTYSDANGIRVALFGYLDGGTVRNLGMKDVSFTGKNYVGAVVGENHGTVENCYNTGSITGTNTIGGVVGGGSGTVTDCYNTGVISGGTNLGGVVGSGSGTVTNCYNTGDISSNNAYVGGIVGYIQSTVGNCYNTGNISGNSRYTGGIAGKSNAAIGNCYNTGSVSGSSSIGGIAGQNNSSIVTCYSTGNLSGSGIGGLAGENNGTLRTSYFNKDNITNNSWTGLAEGSFSGQVINCPGLSTDQMTGSAALTNMTGFDFSGTWYPTNSYPKLRSFFTEVSYLDPSDVNEPNKTQDTFDVITDQTTLEDGKWYVLTANVTINDRIAVAANGTANIILCDGATLTAAKGITVNDGSTLNIYAQSDGDIKGALEATATLSNAGIGGTDGKKCGTVNIYGGTVNASCADDPFSYGAGIGGGYYGAGGEVNVYGGTVNASCGGSEYSGGAGIGGGYKGAGGTVTVYDGTVNASCVGEISCGAGIGGGNNGAGGEVNVYGGEVNASCDGSAYSDGAGIGGGYNGAGADVTINGGAVKAVGGSDANRGIGAGSDNTDNKSLTLGNNVYLFGAGSANPENSIDNLIAEENGDYARPLYMTTLCHEHSFTYTASDSTITAACADGCPAGLDESGVTLTIIAPEKTQYNDGKTAAAALDGLADFNKATSKTISASDVTYEGVDNDYTGTTAPTTAGTYKAKITVEEKTASVQYTISKAASSVTTAPTASAVTYGQKLSDSTLTGGETNTAGTFSWADSTIEPSVSDSGTTEYTVNFTPTDTNYEATTCKVKVTVNKAAPDYTAPTVLEARCGTVVGDIVLPDGFAWNAPDSTVENIGENNYVLTFTPDDTENFEIDDDIAVTVTGIAIHHDEIPAKCEEDGSVEYWEDGLGNAYSDENGQNKLETTVINKLGHNFIHFIEWIWDGLNNAIAWLFCDNDPNHIETIDVPSAVDSIDEPTCTEDGYRYYVATLDIAGEIYTTVNAETIDQLGHKWKEFEWNRNGTKATLTLVCENDPEHTKIVDAVVGVTVNPEGTIRTYTAKVTVDSIEYTKTWTEDILPDTPDTPNTPVDTPDTPNTPDEPVDTPDEPVDTPDEPVDTPDTPNTPDEPVDTPDEPVDTPDEPVDTPDKPTDTDSDTDEPIDTPDTPDTAGLLGDVNQDGVVDSADALLILRASVELEAFSDIQNLLGDVNFDGTVDSADALDVLRYSVQLSANENIGTPVSKTLA